MMQMRDWHFLYIITIVLLLLSGSFLVEELYFTKKGLKIAESEFNVTHESLLICVDNNMDAMKICKCEERPRQPYACFTLKSINE